MPESSVIGETRFNPPLPIDDVCAACRSPLVVVAERRHDLQIKGLRDLEYRHEDGTDTCYLPRKAKPFDAWQATKAFDRARQERQDAQDRELSDG